MLAKIAAYTEAHRPPIRLDRNPQRDVQPQQPATAAEAIAWVAERALTTVPFAACSCPRGPALPRG